MIYHYLTTNEKHAKKALQRVNFAPYHGGLCDPPYGFGTFTEAEIRDIVKYFLNQKPRKFKRHKGFMNAEWDSFERLHPNRWGLYMKMFYDMGILGVFTSAKHEDLVSLAIRLGGWTKIDTVAIWCYSDGNLGAQATHVAKQFDQQDGIIGKVENITSYAQKFDGRYTGLKPQVEYLLLFRKPSRQRHTDALTQFGTGTFDLKSLKNEDKRFPGNLILCHHPNCRYIGKGSIPHKSGSITKEYESKGIVYNAKTMKRRKNTQGKAQSGKECVDIWQCDPDCQVQRFNEDAGAFKSHLFTNCDFQLENVIAKYAGKAKTDERDIGIVGDRTQWNDGRTMPIDNQYLRGEKERLNPHHCIKPLSVTIWAARLILPPSTQWPRRCWNGFAGSKSEAIGASLAGWEEVDSIECEQQYHDVGIQRAEYWLNLAKQCQTANIDILRRITPEMLLQTNLFTG